MPRQRHVWWPEILSGYVDSHRFHRNGRDVIYLFKVGQIRRVLMEKSLRRKDLQAWQESYSFTLCSSAFHGTKWFFPVGVEISKSILRSFGFILSIGLALAVYDLWNAMPLHRHKPKLVWEVALGRTKLCNIWCYCLRKTGSHHHYDFITTL